MEEPSKFHSLRSATDEGEFSRVIVLLRMPPSPSIQISIGLNACADMPTSTESQKRAENNYENRFLSAQFFAKKKSPPDTLKIRKIEETLTLGLNTRTLVKGEVGSKKINSLGGNQLRHVARSENV